MQALDLSGEVVNFRIRRGDDLRLDLVFAIDLTGATIEASVTVEDAPVFELELERYSATAVIEATATEEAPANWGYALVLVDSLSHRHTFYRGAIQVIG